MADASRGVSRGSLDVRILQDNEFDFQLYRSLGAVSYEGGTVGEILSLVPHIDCEDPSTWVKSFKDLATRLKNNALVVLQKGKIREREAGILEGGKLFQSCRVFWRSQRFEDKIPWNGKQRLLCICFQNH